MIEHYRQKAADPTSPIREHYQYLMNLLLEAME